MCEPGRAGTTPRIDWIRGRSEILEARKTGRAFRGEHFILWVSGAGPGHRTSASVGISTGKGFRTAVARNRAKRRLKGCIMVSRKTLEPGLRYLLEGRPGVEKVDYHKLVMDIQSAISRNGDCRKKESGFTCEE